jgi:Flp pilus assembly pilin Flp
LNRFKRLSRGQKGQDMVEYGLLAAFISTATISALLYFGPSLKPFYYRLQDAMRRAAAAHYPKTPGSDDRGGRDATD